MTDALNKPKVLDSMKTPDPLLDTIADAVVRVRARAPAVIDQSPKKQHAAKKHRRPRGSGSVYRLRGIWWISYFGPDHKRYRESTGDPRKGVAETLLQRRIGSREHNLPIVQRAEQLTFHDAAQAMEDDFTANGKKSIKSVQRRIAKHLKPFFGNRRMAGITVSDVTAYVAHRQVEGIVNKKGVRIGDVSNGEINRELQVLKRVFSLAIEAGKLAMKPTSKLLQEAPARSGFFERDQYEAVLKHLPAEIVPIIKMARITGWRIADEILPLQWRQIDFDANEIRLDAGSTKSGRGRVFPMTVELRKVLKAQQVEHARLKNAGHIIPNVFWRMVADERGGEKKPQPVIRFNKVWKIAVTKAGCPGRIPHDLRRTAIRGFVRSGMSENVAMRLSGHQTRSVFDRYDVVSGDDLREAARKLDVAAGR
jgi:integrase